MKAFWFCLIYLFLLPFAFGTETNKQVSVNIDFNLQQKTKDKIEQIFIKKNLTLAATQHDWIIIQNQRASTSTNRFVLLGKIDKANNKQVMMSFLIADAGKNPSVISKPTIVTSYGQRGQITLQDDHTKIELGLLAKS